MIKKIAFISIISLLFCMIVPSFASDQKMDASSKRNNHDVLKKMIKEKNFVDQINEDDAETIVNIINQEKLSSKQANNLVKTWAQNENFGSDAEIIPAIMPNPDSIYYNDNDLLVQSKAYSGGVQTVAHPWDDSGVHYQVRSVNGYNKATGYFELPDLTIKSDPNDPDVPNGHFGIYKDDKLGFDMGVTYIQAYDKWQFNISGYGYQYTDATGAKQYAHYFKTLMSNGSVYRFTKSQHSKIYFIAKAIKQSTYDEIKLTAIDGITWSTIGEIIIDTRYGYAGAPGVTQSFLNSDYSGTYMNREVTLSHKHKSNRKREGTIISNAKWSMVYIYSPTVTTIWGTSQTLKAERIGETTEYANTVIPTIFTKWSEDTCTIDYK